MSYQCQCCNTRNNRGKPVLKDGNFDIFGKIANLKRFFMALIWPLNRNLIWDAIGNDVSFD